MKKKKYYIQINRIEIYYTISILVIIVLLLGCFYVVGKDFVEDERTENLKDITERTREDITLEGGLLQVDQNVSYSSDGAFVVLTDSKGNIIDGDLGHAFTDKVKFKNGKVRMIREDGEKYFIYDRAIRETLPEDADEEARKKNESAKVKYWLRGVTSAELSEMAPSIAGTMRTLSTLIPFLILGILLAGWFVTRRVMAPLRQITETAALIQKEGDLSQRIGIHPRGKRDEIRRTAEVFDSMLDRIEKNFLREKQFTDDAGHELRTPVAVIMAECEYALTNLDDPEELETSLRSILAESHHMSDLISALLMIARADRGAIEVHREWTDLSLLTEECSDRARQSAEEKSIRVEVHAREGIYSNCDRLLIGRALDNLLSNAVKYGREGGFVRVRVEKKYDETVAIIIEDDGIGIPRDEQEKIWDRFYRAENAKAFTDRSGEDESMGLGLALVKWICGAHGGTVACESVEDHGSRFIMTIPLMRV